MWRTRFKPAGVPVFPRSDAPAAPCVLGALLADEPWREAIAWPPGFEGGICHRLDNATSGALLIADHLDALAAARAQFAAGALRKRYLLLAARTPAWADNRCDLSIAHDPRRKSRMVVQRGPNTPHRGKWYPAHTAFRRLDGPLLAAEITTGVTHQIRVHAAFLGVPLAGDPVYGGGPRPPGATDAVPFHLHHLGLRGADGLATGPVPRPAWADRAGEAAPPAEER